MRVGKASQVQKRTSNSRPCSSFQLEKHCWVYMRCHQGHLLRVVSHVHLFGRFSCQFFFSPFCFTRCSHDHSTRCYFVTVSSSHSHTSQLVAVLRLPFLLLSLIRAPSPNNSFELSLLAGVAGEQKQVISSSFLTGVHARCVTRASPSGNGRIIPR